MIDNLSSFTIAYNFSVKHLFARSALLAGGRRQRANGHKSFVSGADLTKGCFFIYHEKDSNGTDKIQSGIPSDNDSQNG